jgi:prevent-host-death family protein
MKVNVYEAKTKLSELLRRAAKGEEVVIARAGKPVAKLVAIHERRPVNVGMFEGEAWMAPDFDDDNILIDLVTEEDDSPTETSLSRAETKPRVRDRTQSTDRTRRSKKKA